ncbi:MAG: hypothetical protein J5U19_02925 [Candidatus Methanoperedens sp.]|nr:hypothetical protein [Candidatus Methanoperedens sp.]MCE8427333.1 hypothetical protein [Candidatus Methanoperedens sp.]
MKIKSLGFKVTDEESGIVFELIPKTEGANQELVEKFFDNFQVLKVETPKVELLNEEIKPPRKQKYVRLKPEKITKFLKTKPETKSIPNPSERQNKELTDLPEEFVITDIGDLFEKEGYERKKIIDNAYHDIYNMIGKNKIITLEGTKPKKYKIVSRDTSDLG